VRHQQAAKVEQMGFNATGSVQLGGNKDAL